MHSLHHRPLCFQDASMPATGGGALLFHGHTLYGAVTDFAEQGDTPWNGEMDYSAFPPARQRRTLVCYRTGRDAHGNPIPLYDWLPECVAGADLDSFIYVYHGIDGVYESQVRAPDDHEIIGQVQTFRLFDHLRITGF